MRYFYTFSHFFSLAARRKYFSLNVKRFWKSNHLKRFVFFVFQVIKSWCNLCEWEFYVQRSFNPFKVEIGLNSNSDEKFYVESQQQHSKSNVTHMTACYFINTKNWFNEMSNKLFFSVSESPKDSSSHIYFLSRKYSPSSSADLMKRKWLQEETDREQYVIVCCELYIVV